MSNKIMIYTKQGIKTLVLGIAYSVFALILSGCVIHVDANGNFYDNDENMESLLLDASDINELFIDVGAGELKVVGVEGQEFIKVTANVVKPEEFEHTLNLRKDEQKALLVANISYPEQHWRGNAYIDLEVTVPSRLLLMIKDSSGDVFVSNIQSQVKVHDSSGDLHLKNIGETLHIVDTSGDIELSNIEGELIVDDGSGDIEGTQFGASVIIEDGSGDIEITDINGVVTLNDGSGDIYVNGATSVDILSDGSGSVKLRNIAE